MYYKTCTEIRKSFAFYPFTSTGKTEEKIGGRWVDNSVPMSLDTTFSFCKSDGS